MPLGRRPDRRRKPRVPPRPAPRRDDIRRCPVCGAVLLQESEHGVTIDVCEEHGIWLDRGELEVVARVVRQQERRTREAAVQEARHEGKMTGAFWGWISLLWND